MEYQVLSRKYRPRTFSEVVGQAHITSTLQKAVSSGRIAQAYIFSGTRGTGKTTMARIFAKALNCVKGPTPEPCNECEVCLGVESGEDVDVIEIDGASHNSVDDVRELRSNAAYIPTRARYKIYYIDEVHMLSGPAFNALLKTLEEPPAHVKFIFATTEPHKIPLTIQSRCQRFDFRNIPPDGILARLTDICKREGIKAEEAALALIARFAQGSMRDAESLLDQVVSFTDQRVTGESVEQVLGVIPAEALSRILKALTNGDAAGALEGVEAVLAAGTSPRQFVAEFVDYLRDVMVAKACGVDSKLLVRSAGEREALAADAAEWGQEGIIYAMQLLSETYARMARSPQTRGLLDVAVVKLAQVDDFLKLKGFLAELREGPVAASAPKKEGGRARPFEEGPEATAPETFEAKWAAVVEGAGAGAVASKILAASEARLDGDKLVVKLGDGMALFHKALIEKAEVRSAVEAAAARAFGRPVRLEVACAADGAPADAEPASERKRALTQKALSDPGVKRLMEVFDGSLVDVEESDVQGPE